MNIVFDFAGVVFHWDPRALLRRELPTLAHDAASTEALYEGIFEHWGGDWASFDRGTVQPEVLAGLIARRTGLERADVRRVMRAIPHELLPHPPMVALIERLRGDGHRLFYLSNMPEPYAKVLETRHPVSRWFDDGVISARVNAIKPEPAIFEIAARRFGVAPGELLFFDDVAVNVEAARAAGWQAELFTDASAAAARVAVSAGA